MTVTIFSTTTCPYCKLLKDYLKGNQIAFTEKLIDTDEMAQKEMAVISNGFLGVPFTTIVDNSGNMQTVLGFDRGKLDDIFELQNL